MLHPNELKLLTEGASFPNLHFENIHDEAFL